MLFYRRVFLGFVDVFSVFVYFPAVSFTFGENATTYRKAQQNCRENATKYRNYNTNARKTQHHTEKCTNCRENATTKPKIQQIFKEYQQNTQQNARTMNGMCVTLPTHFPGFVDVCSVFCCIFPAALFIFGEIATEY